MAAGATRTRPCDTNVRAVARFLPTDIDHHAGGVMRHSTLPIKPSLAPAQPPAKFQPTGRKAANRAPQRSTDINPFHGIAANSDPDAMTAYDDEIRRAEVRQ
jgi:hypothetical protein